MAVLTLRPNADVSRDSLAPSAWSRVDETVVDDGDYNTFAFSGAENKKDVLGFPDHTTEAGGISSVKIYLRAKDVDASGVLRIGVYNDVTWAAPHTLTTSFVTYSDTWATNPATSVEWTWADIDALAAWCRIDGVGSEFIGTSSLYSWLYVEVTYTPGWPHIAKVNGITSSSIAKYNGIAPVNIAKYNGITV
jgi:hypothetical protein